MNRYFLSLLAASSALFGSAALGQNTPPVANQVPDFSEYAGSTRSIDLQSAFTDPDASNAVRFSTVLGNIDVILYGTQKPITVANFLRYVDEGTYFRFDKTTNALAPAVIHRSVYDTGTKSPFVIQGGGFAGIVSPLDKQSWQAVPIDSYGTIKNEPGGYSNVTGTIAMAKVAPQYNANGTLVPGTGPDSATSQWFVNLGNNGGLPNNLDTVNGGYTVFGRLVGDSLNVAYQINALPRFGFSTNSGQVLDNVPLRNYTQTDYNNGVSPKVAPNVVTMSSIAQIPPMTFVASSNNTTVADVTVAAGRFLHIVGKQNGTARITVTATDLDGAPVTQAFNVNVVTAPGRLVNISTRLQVGTGDNVMIGGFIVRGSGTKRLLIRGIGPSLANGGVTSPLPDPTLELHDSTGALLASNDNWQTNSNKAEISDTGVAPTSANESAILATVPANSTGTSYTAVLKGVNNTIGVGLVEVYDLDAGPGSTVLNISTRGKVNTGENAMIGGFFVGGTESKKILVRGIGPSLASQNISGSLPDPQLELRNANGALIDSNDDWQSSPQKAEIIASGVPPSNAKESAMYDVLAPGAYTAILRGNGATPTGVALVEAYQLP